MVRQLRGQMVTNTVVNRFLTESVYEGPALISDIKSTDYLQYQLDLKIRGATIYWHRCYDFVALLDKKGMRGKTLRDALSK